MNKKIITLIIIIGGLFLITAIAVIISGKSETGSSVIPAQIKKPVIGKSEGEKKPVPASAEVVSGDSGKEYEPPIKGALLN